MKDPKLGPGHYDYKTEVLYQKETFNYGKVPFGSSLNRSTIGWGPKLSPGPGSYDVVSKTTAFSNDKSGDKESAIFKSKSPKIKFNDNKSTIDASSFSFITQDQS